jgi:hypothetical protein
MKPYYKLLLPALLLPLFSVAQSNYKPGYVVTLKGDTLKGFINIKEWNVNPRKISFKTAADNNNIKEFGVGDIKFFAATNLEAYQRFTGLLNNDPTNISSIPTARDTSTITDTVFLKIIQKGDNIALFEYSDNKKDHFFVTETKDNRPVELVYRIYSNEGKTVNENGYMQQLYLLAEKFNDNKKLKTRIERADYNYNDLVEISRIINGSTAQDDEAITGKKQGTFFFVSAGLNISKISSDKAFADFDPSVKTTGITGKNSTPTSYFPRIAAGVNVLSNPNTGGLIFRAEIAYTSNKYKGNAVNSGSTETYTLNQNTFSLIPQILYNFYNSDNLKFYGAAGASFNISSYKSKIVYDNSGTITQNANPYGLLSKWTSFPLHIGAVINKKFDVSVAYIPNATFTNTDAYYIQVSAVQVGLNYIFN